RQALPCALLQRAHARVVTPGGGLNSGSNTQKSSYLLRASQVGVLSGLILLLWPQPAEARRFFRARFRPQDLELEEPGELEVETDFGIIYGDGPDGTRVPAPDFALGLGVFDWLEVNLDSSLSQTQVGTKDSQYVGEPLWLSGRFDLYSFNDKKTGGSFGLGAQVGPRLPNIHNATGVGVAGAGLVGGGTEDFNAVLSLGVTLDASQPLAVTYGVDLEYDLGQGQVWSVLGEVAGAHYFSQSQPDQLLLNVGVGAQVSKQVQLTLMAISGPVYRGDRFGLEAGVTYDHNLW
ncbi:MAG: hypothetical protein JWN48_4745, partial [Myxococcaceae bacterium]|nr:hypothetical protein [Myxococcaceae bacterium]